MELLAMVGNDDIRGNGDRDDDKGDVDNGDGGVYGEYG